MMNIDFENIIATAIATSILLATSTCSYYAVQDIKITKYCKISGQCADSLKQQKIELKNEKPLITIGKE